MNIGVYDSRIKNTILLYIQVPENVNDENVKLKALEINLSFLPIPGIHIKRVICENKYVEINEDTKHIYIQELYQGTTIYVVIEITESKNCDSIVAFDDTRLVIDVNYYNVDDNKKINTLINSTITSQYNKSFELLIDDIKKGNRPKIKPCTNITHLYDSDSDNLEEFEMFIPL